MADIDLNEKVRGFLNSAFQKYMVKDVEGAIRDLKASEVLDPDNPEICYNLGICYCRLGLHSTAERYFSRVLSMRHRLIDAMTVRKLLALCLLHQGRYRDAARHLGEVLELAPQDCAAMNMLGYCLSQERDYRAAVRIYRRVVEIDPNNINALNAIAYLLALSGGSLDEALSLSQKVVAEKRSNPAYLDTLGYIYLKKGALSMARRYLTKAREAAPMSEEIRAHCQELDRAEEGVSMGGTRRDSV